MTDNPGAEARQRSTAVRSVRPAIEHALTVYYDGNAEIARLLIDRLIAEVRANETPQGPA
jgi:hypothetical protein